MYHIILLQIPNHNISKLKFSIKFCPQEQCFACGGYKRIKTVVSVKLKLKICCIFFGFDLVKMVKLPCVVTVPSNNNL